MFERHSSDIQIGLCLKDTASEFKIRKRKKCKFLCSVRGCALIMRESDFINGLSAFEIAASIKTVARVKSTIRDYLHTS